MTDVAEFLRGHELFHGCDTEELDAIAQRVEVQQFPAGAVILSPEQAPVGAVHLVRRGAVDLIDQGRPLDRLGEGELFGHPSMLSGLPPGFEVRAAEGKRGHGGLKPGTKAGPGVLPSPRAHRD